MSKLTFNRENALRYQLYLVGHLITKQKKELNKIMEAKQQRLDMRMVMNESPFVWTTMSEVLRPETQILEMEKSITFQNSLVKFLQAKERAIELMIINENDPKIWANQHFEEMSIVDNVLKLYPTKGKQAMKNLVDQIQMRRDDSQPDSNQPKWESIPLPVNAKTQSTGKPAVKSGKYKPKYPKRVMATMPSTSMKMPVPSSAMLDVTEKMAKLTMVAKKLVQTGQVGMVYDWPELDKLNLGIKQIDMPILSRLICEQRNLDWGMPSTLPELSPLKEPEMNLEPMVSPLNSTAKTLPKSKDWGTTPPPRTGVSPTRATMEQGSDNEDEQEVHFPPRRVNTTIGEDGKDGDERQDSEDDSQERRVQNLDCLTQALPGSSKKFKERPDYLRQKSQLISNLDNQDTPNESEQEPPPLECIPSPKTPSRVQKRGKRVRINIPDSPPQSPIILTKNAKRARAPHTRSQVNKKLKVGDTGVFANNDWTKELARQMVIPRALQRSDSEDPASEQDERSPQRDASIEELISFRDRIGRILKHSQSPKTA